MVLAHLVTSEAVHREERSDAAIQSRRRTLVVACGTDGGAASGHEQRALAGLSKRVGGLDEDFQLAMGDVERNVAKAAFAREDQALAGKML
jgi:hypothetical protein